MHRQKRQKHGTQWFQAVAGKRQQTGYEQQHPRCGEVEPEVEDAVDELSLAGHHVEHAVCPKVSEHRRADGGAHVGPPRDLRNDQRQIKARAGQPDQCEPWERSRSQLATPQQPQRQRQVAREAE